MQETVAVGGGEEVALQLDTDVAAAGGFLTGTVAEAREPVDDVGIGIPALGDGVCGVLEGEGAFELSYSQAGLLVFHPLSVEVNQLHGGFARTFGVGALDLCAPVPVADFSVEDQTHQAEVELVVFGALLVVALVLQHAVAAEFEVVIPLLVLLGAHAHRYEGQQAGNE